MRTPLRRLAVAAPFAELPLLPRPEALPAAVRPATSADVSEIVPLFTAYQAFYGVAFPEHQVREWLHERFVERDTTMLIALVHDRVIGFAHLRRAVSSLRLADTWTIDDLFVSPAYRGIGAGHTLLRAALAHACGNGAAAIDLVTERTNLMARRFYERAGYRVDQRFVRYEFDLR